MSSWIKSSISYIAHAVVKPVWDYIHDEPLDTAEIKIELEKPGNYEICTRLPEMGFPLKQLRSCPKNPGHVAFIQVKDFKEEHLPKEHRDPLALIWIRWIAQLTVKITSGYVSPNRPDGYPLSAWRRHSVVLFGSGFVTEFVGAGILSRIPEFNTFFSCSGCRHEFCGYFVMVTAAHIVFDTQEARNAEIEFFYDDPLHKFGVVRGHGIRVLGKKIDSDFSEVLCVIHDQAVHTDLIKSFGERVWSAEDFEDTKTFEEIRRIEYTAFVGVPWSNLAVHISHPHGMSKRISVGMPNASVNDSGHYYARYDTPTCPGCSGGPVWMIPPQMSSRSLSKKKKDKNQRLYLFGVLHSRSVDSQLGLNQSGHHTITPPVLRPFFSNDYSKN